MLKRGTITKFQKAEEGVVNFGWREGHQKTL